MRRILLLSLLTLSALSTPILAQDRTEDVRLKGRGAGRGVAFFWNTTDDATRRMIIVGGSILIVVGLGFGIRQFVRETKQLRAPRVKQPWDM